MGGKYRKSRYDSSSLSATDTSDSSSSDSEVSFVSNHSHRHKSQHRINKLNTRRIKSTRKIEGIGHQALTAENHLNVNTKNISIMVQNIIKSKSTTQIVTPTEQIMRDIVIEILMTGICQDRIAYHSERDKFDDGYHYRDQDSYDRAPKADSHDRYYRDRYAIVRHYDRDRDRDGYYKRDNHDRGKYFADHSHDETVGYHSEHQINSKHERKDIYQLNNTFSHNIL